MSIVLPKDIKYPKIYYAAKLITDNYWSNVLEDISKGRCPKKCSIDSNNCTFTQRRSKMSYNYQSLTEQEIADELPKLISHWCGICSNKDVNREKTVVDSQLDTFNAIMETNDWKKIKNKRMRKDLLIHWAIIMKEEHNLRWNEARRLDKMLDDAFFNLTTHTSDDIQIYNGRIVSIEDIEIVNGKAVNHRFNLDWNEKSEKSAKEKRKTLFDKWNNYVKGIVDF